VFVRSRARRPKTAPVTELPAGTRVSGIVPDGRHPGTVRIEVGGKALLTVPSAALDRLGSR
jgi:hypothetical protein